MKKPKRNAWRNVNFLKINYFTPKFTPEGKICGFNYDIEEVGEQEAALEVFQTFSKRKLKINSDEITEIEVPRAHRVGKLKEESTAYYRPLSSLWGQRGYFQNLSY